MHISSGFGAAISITTLVLIALVSTLITTETRNPAFTIPSTILAQAGNEITIVVMPPVGAGNTDPTPDNYTVPVGGNFSVAALASPGSYFDLWVVSTINMTGKGGTSVGSVWSNDYNAGNPLTIQCEQGCEYYLQAVFKANPGSLTAFLPFGLTATATIAFLVTVAIVEAAVLGFFYTKRGKK